jgi:hypothetical protein
MASSRVFLRGLLGTLLAALAAVSVAGCSSSSGSGGGAGSQDADVIGCSGLGDLYAANMHKPGLAGQMQFVLVSSDPGPPIVGTNTWTVQVLDGGGKPVKGAAFTWLPGDKSIWMPQHGHGSTAQPVVTDNGDGSYTITPLYFFMAGLWQVTLQAKAGTMTDSVVYSFCVGG